MAFQRLSEGSKFESLVLEKKFENWEIYSVDSDDEVQISVDSVEGTKCLYLSQDELKVLIEFLQRQVK